MRWIAKAGLQKVLGGVPRGREVNYLLQRRTGGLPFGDEKFLDSVRSAVGHYRNFQKHASQVDPSQAALYEFGAGWDLTVPLTYAALGVPRQTIVDLDPLMKTELVNHGLEQFERLRDQVEECAGTSVRALGAEPIVTAGDLETRFGIRYLAPRDARRTGLPQNSFDLVTSTNTMEHIPAEDIPPIYAECRRLLRPGGILSCGIDTQDHYSYGDPAVSRYNYLRFSERTWRLVNSPLHFQNRLRCSDHLRLVEQAGFEVLSVRREHPSGWELEKEELRQMALAPRFRDHYELDDLGTTGVHVVAVNSG